MNESLKNKEDELKDYELFSNPDEHLNNEEYLDFQAETDEAVKINDNVNDKFSLDNAKFDAVSIEIYEENMLLKLLGSLVAGLGLFLFGSKTSGLVSQISGYAIFIVGVLIVTS